MYVLTYSADLTTKQDLQPGAAAGNIAIWNTLGQTVDSGEALNHFVHVREGTLNYGEILNNAGSIEMMAHDDGDGNLIGGPIDPGNPSGDHFQIPRATVNYADGSIGDVIVTFGLTEPFANYQIRIDFELDDIENGDLKPTLRNQLIAWYGDETQTRLML